MFTDQDIYNIAEWLAYNRDGLLFSIGHYKNNEELKHKVMFKVVEHFRKLAIEDVMGAFTDEKILLVFDFYFVHKRDVLTKEH